MRDKSLGRIKTNYPHRIEFKHGDLNYRLTSDGCFEALQCTKGDGDYFFWIFYVFGELHFVEEFDCDTDKGLQGIDLFRKDIDVGRWQPLALES